MSELVRSSVIIPTMVSTQRATSLQRAIGSIIGQQSAAAVPIVVANGTQFDAQLLSELKSRRDIRFFYQEEGSLPGAILLGRKQVDTEFFANLDDDDEYLPNAI